MFLGLNDEYRCFNSTFVEGIQTEKEIRNYIKTKGFKVIDRSNEEEYQKKDIDFEYSSDGENYISVEVKSDNRMYKTGNIAVELAMHRNCGIRQGWFHYCEADILCFYDNVSDIAYFINWKKLKYEITNHRWSFTMFDNKIDNCKGSLCLIPVKDLEKLNLLLWVTKIKVGA